MNRWAGLALVVLMATLFLVANRGAYQGYFQDDELDNISWTPYVPLSEFAKTLVTPRYLNQNFRPVGHSYFHFMGGHFDLDFPKYLVPIHLLHFLNVCLIWFLLRGVGASPLAACAGSLFFAFHMAVFDVYWKPMYVFDVLCATFCLLSILLYTRGRLVWSFVAFWLAYKSKELAVMLPAVLASYEFWLGRKRWKPLVPFFLVSLSFGMQGLLFNPNRDNDYTFRFTPAALAVTSTFYAAKLFLIPYAGFAFLAIPFLTRDRRAWFGLTALLLFFFPLAFLPGRLFGAYCYLPLTGAAVALAFLFERRPWFLAAAFFLLWIPWNYVNLRQDRKQALAIAAENRRYVTALGDFARNTPDIHTFVYDGRPPALNVWGIRGALQHFYRRFDLRLASIDDPDGQAALHDPSLAVLSWDQPRSQLQIVARHPGTPDVSFIQMDRATPLWQLESGWYALENRFRWTQPVATARLLRPAGPAQFALTVNIGPDMIRDIGRTEVSVLLNGQLLGRHEFVRNGWQTVRWDVAPGTSGAAEVELRIQPPYHPSNQDPRPLGVAVGSFGFSAKEPS